MSGFIIEMETVPAAARKALPAGASPTFDAGDPVVISSATIVGSVRDDTQLLVAEIDGFAYEATEGLRASSRPADSGTAALAAGFNGPNSMRGYIDRRAAPEMLLSTRTVYATGAPGTADTPVAADRGTILTLVGDSGDTTYGVERTAGGSGEIGALILEVFNNDGLDVNEHGGTGVGYLFSIVEVA